MPIKGRAGHGVGLCCAGGGGIEHHIGSWCWVLPCAQGLVAPWPGPKACRP